MSANFAPYRKLLKRTRAISFLTSSASALTWDVETYMPPKALAFRAEQLAYLGGEAHRMFTSKTSRRVDCRVRAARFRPGVRRGGQRARVAAALRPCHQGPRRASWKKWNAPAPTRARRGRRRANNPRSAFSNRTCKRCWT